MMRLVLVAALMLSAAPAAAQAVNDYPTNARADYVFVCMAANGQTRQMLDKCSCAIDRIAEILSYDDYVRAETVLSLRQVGGERTSVFRQGTTVNEMVAHFRRAEAEAEILCF